MIVVISINYIVTVPVCGIKTFSMLSKLSVVTRKYVIDGSTTGATLYPRVLLIKPDHTRWLSCQRLSDISLNHPNQVLIMLKDPTPQSTEEAQDYCWENILPFIPELDTTQVSRSSRT